MARQSIRPLLSLTCLLALAAAASAAHKPPPKALKQAVEGVVLCQSCPYVKTSSLTGAKLLPKAMVFIRCSVGMKVIFTKLVTADANGYFFSTLDGVEDPVKSCYVRLRSSPDAHCKVPTNINYGIAGAAPRGGGTAGDLKLYQAGPFAFRPTYLSCLKY